MLAHISCGPGLRVCLTTLIVLILSGICWGGQLPAQLGGSGLSGTTVSIPPLVAGQVINALNGAPLPRVLVELNGAALFTDQEGRFRFEQPGQGVSAIRLRKPGFSDSPEAAEGASSGAPGTGFADSLTLMLWPEALLTGTVTAPDAEPLAHIPVTARRSIFDEQGHHFQVAGQAQTDSHGQFRIPVTAGDYVIETQFSQRRYDRDEAVLPSRFPVASLGSSEQFVHLASGEERRIELRPVVGTTHLVTIPLEEGEGQAPRITVRSKDGLTFSSSGSRSTDPGAVRLNLPSGIYTLNAMRVSQAGVQFGESSIAVGSQDVTGSVLHVASLPNIQISLVADATGGQALPSNTAVRVGDAVPNLMQFNLLLEPLEADPNSPFQFGIRPTQQRDGSASFAAPPGSYRLRAGLASGWYVRSATSRGTDLTRDVLVISPGASTPPITVIVSNQSGSVQGNVTLSGLPAACWIHLIANSPALPQVVTGRSDASGAFRIANLPSGSYKVVAFPYRHSADLEDPAVLERFATHVGAVTIASGASATLDLDAVSPSELMR